MNDITEDGSAGGVRASGRFLLRIDPERHAALRAAARRLGVSLNEHCARKLAWPGGPPVGPAAGVVERAIVLLGDEVLGVVVFGSWSRDELAAGSDVDVLVVVDEAVGIRRSLYRRWDADPVSWDAHPVEPHFVHLPESAARVSGIWAEVAVDGVVLFDRDLALSRYLVGIRRRIVAGELVRREVHGQPYWVEAA